MAGCLIGTHRHEACLIIEGMLSIRSRPGEFLSTCLRGVERIIKTQSPTYLRVGLACLLLILTELSAAQGPLWGLGMYTLR